MSTIEVGDNDRLDFEADREAVRLYPAVAGARIDLRLRAGRMRETVPPRQYRIAAHVDVSKLSQQGRRRLCRVETDHLVTPAPRPTPFELTGFISDEQLRVVEDLRAGGDLWFALSLNVWTVCGDPVALTAHTGSVDFSILAGEWGAQLERVDAGTFVELLVPMPQASTYAIAVRRLQRARELLRDNQVDAALGEARKALEPALEAARDGGLAKAARAKPATQRLLDERFAVLVEDMFSLLSGAAHDDEVTKDFRYSRAEATTLIATTAGLLNRLAQQA